MAAVAAPRVALGEPLPEGYWPEGMAASGPHQSFLEEQYFLLSAPGGNEPEPMPPRQQGRGTHTFHNGTYTGEWRGGKRHGQGAMAYTNGDRCVRHASLLKREWPCRQRQWQAAGGRRQAAGGGRRAAGGRRWVVGGGPVCSARAGGSRAGGWQHGSIQ